jgi:hypothetical protein
MKCPTQVHVLKAWSQVGVAILEEDGNFQEVEPSWRPENTGDISLGALSCPGPYLSPSNS